MSSLDHILDRELEIRMPQMANGALSEYWLLKELGDIHWELISRGLQQKSSQIKDKQGNRLYASFVRLIYSMSPLNYFNENELLHFTGRIDRFKGNSFLSNIYCKSFNNFIDAKLLSKFTVRELNDNSRIFKSNPDERKIQINELNNIPSIINEHSLMKKGQLKELKSNGVNYDLKNKIISSREYYINPYYEINGVGLLYFACYPIISDKCTIDYFREEIQLNHHIKSYQTITRDVFYFANCNINDCIFFELNAFDFLENDELKTITSLYRKSDRRLMAKIFTLKKLSFEK